MRLVQAMRHRAGQGVALALLAALVVACAAVAPMTTRSVEQGLLRSRLAGDADPARSATSVVLGRSPSSPETPADVEAAIGPALRAVHDEPIGELRAGSSVEREAGKEASPVVVRSRDDMCEHVVVAGRCPGASGETLVSTADAQAWGWQVGDELSVEYEVLNELDRQVPVELALTITGTYEAGPDEAYWLGSRPDGKSGVPMPEGLAVLIGVDDLLVAPSTFERHFPFSEASVQLPLRPEAVALDDIAAVEDDLAALAETPGLRVTDVIDERLTLVRAGQEQVRTIVPVVAAQLALVAALVLLLVTQVAADSRRQEIALLRLRGRSRSAARRVVLAELALPVLLGVVPGVALAIAADALVRALLLPAGLPWEVPLAVWPAVLVAVGAALVAILLAIRPVLAEPVGALLRPASGRRGGSGAVDAVVVALAVAGTTGLATGSLSGAASLLTPTLLALAAGLLLARLVTRLADRRARRGGSVVATLAAASTARRAGPRRVLVVTAVATALAVVGASWVAVADRNRLARAELEVGAPAVVSTAATSVTPVTAAADRLRAEGVAVSPVVVVRPADPGADAVLAVDAQTFGQVSTADLDLAPFATPAQEPVVLDGGRLRAELDWQEEQGSGAFTLRAALTRPDGAPATRTLTRVTGGGTSDLDVDLDCTGCRLAGLQVQPDGGAVRGRLVVTDLREGQAPLPLLDDGAWTTDAAEGAADQVVVTGDGQRLTLEVTTGGADVGVHTSDIPQPLPALVTEGAGSAEREGPFSLTSLGAQQVEVTAVAQVPQLPEVTDRGVLVSLPTLARLAAELDPRRSTAELWVAEDDPATLERVRAVLEDEGVVTTGTSTVAAAKAELDASASAWGLALALVGAVAVLLLAALVVVLSGLTSRREVTHDLAALHVSGVPLRALRTSVLREQVVVVGLGVLLGAAVGTLGAWLGMPGIPLFEQPAAVPVLDATPPWAVVAGVTLLALVVLGSTALLVARATGARVRPELLRDVE